MNYYDHAKEIHLTNSHRVLAFIHTMQVDLDTKDITIARLQKTIDDFNFMQPDYRMIKDLGEPLPNLVIKQAGLLPSDEIDLTKGSE